MLSIVEKTVSSFYPKFLFCSDSSVSVPVLVLDLEPPFRGARGLTKIGERPEKREGVTPGGVKRGGNLSLGRRKGRKRDGVGRNISEVTSVLGRIVHELDG